MAKLHLTPPEDSLFDFNARTKLRRAQVHRLEVRRLIESLPDLVHVSPRTSGPWIEWVITDVEALGEELAAEIGVVTGDALQNYRAALDHAVWALVDANDETPDRHTRFPILTTRDDTALRKALRGIARDRRDVIESLQPDGAMEAFGVLLRLLHDLSRIDRHRRLTVVVGGFDTTIERDRLRPWDDLSELFVGEASLGAVVARLSAGWYPDVTPRLKTDLVFSEEEAIAWPADHSRSVLRVLGAIEVVIEMTLMCLDERRTG